MAAADMFARGKRQVDVVDALGVSAQTASRWHRIFLAEAERTGRCWPGRSVAEAVRRAAGAGGAGTAEGPAGQQLFDRDVDPGAVADVIETVTGVRYGQTQTWTVLRERLGGAGSVRRGARSNATTRRSPPGSNRIAAHKKSARRRGAWIVFQDESGFSLLPPVRGTWAPKGRTPVLRHRFSWTRLSMSAHWPTGPTPARPHSCSRSRRAPTTPTH